LPLLGTPDPEMPSRAESLRPLALPRHFGTTLAALKRKPYVRYSLAGKEEVAESAEPDFSHDFSMSKSPNVSGNYISLPMISWLRHFDFRMVTSEAVNLSIVLPGFLK
jgi:hypothetical protein